MSKSNSHKSRKPLSRDELVSRISEILERIDMGSEQSRQFSEEIKLLKKLRDDFRSKPIASLKR